MMNGENFDEVGQEQDWCFVEEDEKTEGKESEELPFETSDNVNTEKKFPNDEPMDKAVDVGTSNSIKGCDSDSSVDVLDDQDCLDDCWENVGCDLISKTRRSSDVHVEDTTLSEADNLKSLLLSSEENIEGISKLVFRGLVAGMMIICCITMLYIKKMELTSNPMCFKDNVSKLLNKSNETMPLQLKDLLVLQKQIEDLRKQLQRERKKNKELSRNVSDCSAVNNVFHLLNQTITLDNLNGSVLAIAQSIWMSSSKYKTAKNELMSSSKYKKVKNELMSDDDHIMYDDLNLHLFLPLQYVDNSQLIVNKDNLHFSREKNFIRVASEFQSYLNLKLETMYSAVTFLKNDKIKESRKQSKIQMKGFAEKFRDLALKVLKPVKQNSSKLGNREVLQIKKETDYRVELFSFIDSFLSHNPNIKNCENFNNLRVNLISFKSSLDAAGRSQKNNKKRETKILLKQLKRVNSDMKKVFSHCFLKNGTSYDHFLTLFKNPLGPSLADFYLGELAKFVNSRKFAHLSALQQHHLACQCHWWNQFYSGTTCNIVRTKLDLSKDACSLALHDWQNFIENHIKQKHCRTVAT